MKLATLLDHFPINYLSSLGICLAVKHWTARKVQIYRRQLAQTKFFLYTFYEILRKLVSMTIYTYGCGQAHKIGAMAVRAKQVT